MTLTFVVNPSSFLSFAQEDNVRLLTSSSSLSLTNALTYSNPTYNISIKYPSNWEKDETDYNTPESRSKTIVGFISPLENPSDPYRESLYISRDEGIFYDADLNEFLGETVDAYESDRTVSDFELLQSDTASTLGGMPAYSLTYTSTLEAENEDEEDVPLKSYEIGVLVNKTAYYITFDAEESAFDEYFRIAQGMIDTFANKTRTKTDPSPPTTTTVTPPTTTTVTPPTTMNQITQSPPPAGFKEYINSGYGIKMIYPSNWDVEPPKLGYSSPYEVVRFISPERSVLDLFLEFVTLSVREIGTNAPSNMQDYLDTTISESNIP